MTHHVQNKQQRNLPTLTKNIIHHAAEMYAGYNLIYAIVDHLKSHEINHKLYVCKYLYTLIC